MYVQVVRPLSKERQWLILVLLSLVRGKDSGCDSERDRGSRETITE